VVLESVKIKTSKNFEVIIVMIIRVIALLS
jgi:hypothetical protein